MIGNLERNHVTKNTMKNGANIFAFTFKLENAKEENFVSMNMLCFELIYFFVANLDKKVCLCVLSFQVLF